LLCTAKTRKIGLLLQKVKHFLSKAAAEASIPD
jgi:hypothetical protein